MAGQADLSYLPISHKKIYQKFLVNTETGNKMVQLSHILQRELGLLPVKVRGQIEWGISPYEQRAFPNMLSKIPNTVRRIKSMALIIGIPFSLFYLEYNWYTSTHYRLHRKENAEELAAYKKWLGEKD